MFLVIACLVVGIFPGADRRALPACCCVVGARRRDSRIQPGDLAWLHCSASNERDRAGGGALLISCAGDYLERSERSLLFGRIQGQRIFERVTVAISWRWARLVEEVFGTRRLQPQMRLLVATAIAAGAIPILAPGLGFGGSGNATADLAFAGLWCVGMVCAVAAAHQANSTVSLLCPVGRNRACDLRDLRLVIGAGSRGYPACCRDRYDRPHPARPAWLPKRSKALIEPSGLLDRLRRFRPVAGRRGRLGHDGDLLRSHDAHAAGLDRGLLHRKGLQRRRRAQRRQRDPRRFPRLRYPGRITVLGIVALTVFALLRRFRPAPDSIERPEQQRIQRSYDEAEPDREAGATAAEYLYVPSVIMQWMFPVVILLSAYLFLRGHDAPGGGFVAGVAMAAGFILQYMAAGTVWVEDRLRILPSSG